MIEPDSWNGVGHNQLSTVEFEYEDFKLEWRYSEIPEAEGRTKDLSMLTVHQNLDDRTQNVDHARNLYPLLTRKSLQPDSCRKVFQDVERFLSDPPYLFPVRISEKKPFYSQSSNAEKFSDLEFCGTAKTLDNAAQNFPGT